MILVLARRRRPCDDRLLHMATRTHASRRACAAVAAALALLPAGCGGSDEDDAPDANSPQAAIERKIAAVQADVKARPEDPEPLAELAKAHFQAATLESIPTGGYTDEGRKQLRLAALAWERHLAKNPDPPDIGVAQLMAAAYGPGALQEPKNAVRAQRIITENADPPSASMFAQLAQMAHLAGDGATAARAADRALELTPEDERERLREALRFAAERARSQP